MPKEEALRLDRAWIFDVLFGQREEDGTLYVKEKVASNRDYLLKMSLERGLDMHSAIKWAKANDHTGMEG